MTAGSNDNINFGPHADAAFVKWLGTKTSKDWETTVFDQLDP